MENQKQREPTAQESLMFLREKTIFYSNKANELRDFAYFEKEKDILLGQKQAYDNMVGVINGMLGGNY